MVKAFLHLLRPSTFFRFRAGVVGINTVAFTDTGTA
jgi:hypothetical protein